MTEAGRHEPQHPDLLRLHRYWQDRRGTRSFPRRADLDVVDLGFMLDRIALTEVHDDPRRYRLRVVGSWWAPIAGRELTGTWIDEWPQAKLRKLTVDTYEEVIAAAPRSAPAATPGLTTGSSATRSCCFPSPKTVCASP